MKAMETNEPNEWRVDFKELAVHTQKHRAGYAVGCGYKKNYILYVRMSYAI